MTESFIIVGLDGERGVIRGGVKEWRLGKVEKNWSSIDWVSKLERLQGPRRRTVIGVEVSSHHLDVGRGPPEDFLHGGIGCARHEIAV